MLMLHLGEDAERISVYLGISADTVSVYAANYEREGLSAYLSDHYQAYQGKLSAEEQEMLRAELNRNLYTNTAQIKTYIQDQFSKCYSQSGLFSLLHRLGFSYKKTKLVPCEADIAKQETFLAEFKALMSGLSEKEAVYFVDAVHPQHNTRSTYAWIAQGEEREILSVSGRNRVNFNGALNAQNVSEVMIVEGQSINAENTWELYQKIEAQNPEKERIFVIGDNARYYKNRDLTQKLKGSKIVQIFLPPYSPNLNLIERLWKFTRKKVIDSHFYRTFSEFRSKLLDFFVNIHLYKAELETMLSWNFHIQKPLTTSV
ncbi:MAG: IS630 family transposase [Microscillaceae bacterium]|nr:IS630 family transposase [Microscillaceae bacterium]